MQTYINLCLLFSKHLEILLRLNWNRNRIGTTTV